jgi:hypothetical protein
VVVAVQTTILVAVAVVLVVSCFHLHSLYRLAVTQLLLVRAV